MEPVTASTFMPVAKALGNHAARMFKQKGLGKELENELPPILGAAWNKAAERLCAGTEPPCSPQDLSEIGSNLGQALAFDGAATAFASSVFDANSPFDLSQFPEVADVLARTDPTSLPANLTLEAIRLEFVKSVRNEIHESAKYGGAVSSFRTAMIGTAVDRIAQQMMEIPRRIVEELQAHPVLGPADAPSDLRIRLPGRVVSFTGRADELRWLTQIPSQRGVFTQVLAGLGGVGKTALALEHAHRCFYDEHSVDLVWWFTATDRLSLTAAMADLYEQLTRVPRGEDSVLAAERLRNWLENTSDRWLLIFDNAEDPPGPRWAHSPCRSGSRPHHLTPERLVSAGRRRTASPCASPRRLDRCSTHTYRPRR